jgi:hypothetical protein
MFADVIASVTQYLGSSKFSGIILLMAICSVSPALAASLHPDRLTCEFKKDPLGISATAPRFSWNLAADDSGSSEPLRGLTQTAWQVLAATTPGKLQTGSADLWDSGQQHTSESLLTSYGGLPLVSNQTVYWTVRTWDQDNAVSAWAPLAKFITALLKETEWKGEWIGTERRDLRPVQPSDQLYWVWSAKSQSDPGEEVSKTQNRAAAGAVRYFRVKFSTPPNAKLRDARVYVVVDNEADIYLNGTHLAKATDWRNATTLDIGAHLHADGENYLNLRVKNGGTEPNAAGLGVVIELPTTEKTIYLNAKNTQFESSRAPGGKGWPEELTAHSTESAKWEPANVIGPIGVNPWNKVSFGTHPDLPIFRKEFTPAKRIRRALVHVSGLGQYVLSVNGKKIGDHFMDPPWSRYEETVYYNTFDVTEQMSDGANAVGVMLGKGFYNTAGDRRVHGAKADRPLALIFQMNVEYDDGSTTQIVSDKSWKWTRGPLLHNSILGGVSYDARQLPDGWNKPGFDDSEWKNVINTDRPGGILAAVIAPPMRTFDERKPITVEEPAPGHFVYNFGQNISAVPHLEIRGKAGSTVTLTWAEQRNGQSPHTNNGKGEVNQSGIGDGYISYTLSGDPRGETWMPELFYTGFQYIEVTGAVPEGHANADGLPVITGLTQVHVRSDEAPVGEFACSNEMYNRIDRMIDAAVRSNLGHVFTDCPTREKLGWLEVPWLMWASVSSRYEMDAFVEKITRDIRDSQRDNGQIPTVAPSYASFQKGFDYTAEWGAAGVFLPWYGYEWYADKSILEQNYMTMKRFVDYLKDSSDELIAAPGLGDWYDYGHGEKLGESRFTPTELTATAVFAGCADIVSSSAAVLGKPEDQKAYAKLAAEVRQAFNRKFRKGPGQYENTGSPQTAHAMAITFNIVPENEREACVQEIIKDLRERGWQQTSGDVGYRFLINALSQTGHSDVIFKILNRDQLGSYCYLVNAGWTSLPEAWNAWEKSSFNHCMLGHIQEWFTQCLLGIAQEPDSLGFSRITIQPTPGDTVTSATGSFESPRGKITLDWKQDAATFSCSATIPPNTRAVFRLPLPAGARVTESGRPVVNSTAVKYIGREQGRELFEVGSGTYKFVGSIN